MKLAELLLVIWGYKHVRTLDWLKLTKNGIIFKCMGKPENRSNERCLVGIKGDVDFETDFNFAIEKVIQEQMREKSQKPDFLYRIVDQAFPDNIKMELFARKCNLRNFYISIGIEFLEKIFK
ncbi:n6-adenosine-methyltransferase catalytic subunit [Anaeramoeba flamelloides]|uniref:mRNA m(6)A methyltransferase n=1 Tax=Anaeramoeba flamelloides TaxID=1746091 RepID=A0ABQ8XI46_9EUKA|nr:n6-adenosine-methyltransferase catalytic subunit [Anaeramoeba flamelloides]